MNYVFHLYYSIVLFSGTVIMIIKGKLQFANVIWAYITLTFTCRIVTIGIFLQSFIRNSKETSYHHRLLQTK